MKRTVLTPREFVFGFLMSTTLAIILMVALHYALSFCFDGDSIAAEQKQPPPVVATEKPAEPETPAAVQQATAILDILGIVKPTLPEVLNDFVILGQQQGMKSSDTEEAKAQFFLLQMRGFVYQNCKKVAVARTEAAFDSAFKLKDTPQ